LPRRRARITQGSEPSLSIPLDEARQFVGWLKGQLGGDVRSGQSPYIHLIKHCDNQGFYLPVDFAKPFELPLSDDPARQPFVGSSIKLLRKLNALSPKLEAASKMSGEAVDLVKSGWIFMHGCARLSVQYRMPIIFDG
jgi:hypothetical protein